ncbi:MAG: hypothetical protein HY613_02185 [Candidatus Rokubacteria bacterium]|nr:hypothetical protein [Candidatus Rokubacteria bacterium]
MVAHPLAGHLSVEESAELIRQYRYAEERMMRVMGGWIALTPELSAKLLLGRHVWDCAQHADLWGKRLPELRAPAHVSAPASEAFVRLMDLLESQEGFHQTPERLAGIYEVLKPHLLAAYQDHLAHTNPVYEPPTRRILERIVEEERRHIAAGRVVLSHLITTPAVEARTGEWRRRLEGLLLESGGVSGKPTGDLRGPDVPVDPTAIAQDLARLERPVGRWPVPAELEASVEAHALHLKRRDLQALEDDFAPAYRQAGMATYAPLLAFELATHRIVGLGKLGGHRLVKLRLEGPAGTAVVQLRWAETDGRWRVLEAEVVRTEAAAASS